MRKIIVTMVCLATAVTARAEDGPGLWNCEGPKVPSNEFKFTLVANKTNYMMFDNLGQFVQEGTFEVKEANGILYGLTMIRGKFALAVSRKDDKTMLASIAFSDDLVVDYICK
jgi:hypothetical protein